MTAHLASADIHRVSQSLERALREPDEDQATAPIRAGMRARAIADACETLGLAAILIDGTGRVLHIGAAAAELLDGQLGLAAGHLVGATRAMNQAVQRAVTTAIGSLGPYDLCQSLEAVSMTITGLQYRDPSSVQLLRGVLVLSREGERSPASLQSIQRLLAA